MAICVDNLQVLYSFIYQQWGDLISFSLFRILAHSLHVGARKLFDYLICPSLCYIIFMVKIWDTRETGDLTVIVGSRTHFVRKKTRSRLSRLSTLLLREDWLPRSDQNDFTNVNAVVFARSRGDLREVLLHYLANIYNENMCTIRQVKFTEILFFDTIKRYVVVFAIYINLYIVLNYTFYYCMLLTIKMVEEQYVFLIYKTQKLQNGGYTLSKMEI